MVRMNLEHIIKQSMEEKMKDGIVEKMVSEQLEKTIQSVVADLLGNYGEITTAVKKNIKKTMIPTIEEYDYSSFVPKLDELLVGLIKESTGEHRKLLENFNLYTSTEAVKEISVEQIFDKWCQSIRPVVEGEETFWSDGLEMTTVICNWSIEEIEKPSWSETKEYNVFFECAEDNQTNLEFKIVQYGLSSNCYIKNVENVSFHSLRVLGELEVELMKYRQLHTVIKFDTDEMNGSLEKDVRVD